MKWWMPFAMIFGYALLVGVVLGAFYLGIELIVLTFDDPPWWVYLIDIVYFIGGLYLFTRKNLSKAIKKALKQISNNY